jgi:hypothetical protein
LGCDDSDAAINDDSKARIKQEFMETQSKPAWAELNEQIRNAWIQQTHAFYPVGSTTIAEAVELARYEYEQLESESLLPPVEPATELEIT